MKDIIRVHSERKADVRFHDGALPHAIGTHCVQVMRATQNPDTATDGNGWSYNHAAMICFWNGEFYVDYLCGPVSEHLPPSKTMITWSKDGYEWSKPVDLFSELEVPSKYYIGPQKEEIHSEKIACVMHQRMSFYVTKDNRLLATGFYGISPTHTLAPNNGYGVGRVVREIYADHSFSDMYFLRFNEPAGYTKDAVDFIKPYYEAEDKGFVTACEELLNNRLVTAQMWEEERLHKDAFTQPGAEAFCYFTLPDESVTAVYKKSLVTRSFDKGKSWKPLELDYSLETSTGKVWGERTSDGKYVLAYNPTTDSAHRWPIALVTGENGEDFYKLMAVTPEVSPHKYAGLYKNLGPQYMRGIVEANPKPDNGRFYLAYTVNKEDVWTSSVKVPITAVVTEEIHESFDTYKAGDMPVDWNIYSPVWSPVKMIESDGKAALALFDADPYDRARAMRIFPKYEKCVAKAVIVPDGQDEKTAYTIDMEDESGRVAVRFIFNNAGEIIVKNGGRYDLFTTYKKGEELKFKVEADCRTNKFTLAIRQGDVTEEAGFALSNSVYTVERILFTSKTTLPFNDLEDCGKYGDLGNLPGADFKHEEGRLLIKSLDVYEED